MGFSSCGARAQLLRSMWDLPGPGLEPVSLALASGFLTTAPPGKPEVYSSHENGREQVETREDIKVLVQKLLTSTHMPLTETSYRANPKSKDRKVYPVLPEVMQKYGCRKRVGIEAISQSMTQQYLFLCSWLMSFTC